MIVVGMIGRIGAGKSTVAGMFAAHGAHVVDADRIAHGVLVEEDVKAEIDAAFGAGVRDERGEVSRRALASRVFGDAEALGRLEAIVHPRVRRRISAELERLARTGGDDGGEAVVVLDVPLLVQGGWDSVCDLLVVVDCAEDVRRRRLEARGWNERERRDREAAWDRRFSGTALPAGKIRTVDTSGNLAYTRRQVEDIWSELRRSPGPLGRQSDGDETSSWRGGRPDDG
jgi:dephospho-CoA kinase